MEDEGRQRTTKYITCAFAEESDLSRQFEREKARSEQLAMATVTVVHEDSLPGEELSAAEEEVLLSESENEEEEREGARPRKASTRSPQKLGFRGDLGLSTPDKGAAWVDLDGDAGESSLF